MTIYNRTMPSLQKHKQLANMQEVTFHLPKQYEIPLVLFSVNESDFANILQSASKIFEFQKQSAFTAQQDEFIHEQIQQKTTELLDQLAQTKKHFEKELRHAKQEVKEAEERLVSQELENEKLRIQNQTIRDTIQSTATEQSELRVQDFRLQIQKLEQRIEKEKDSFEKEKEKIQEEKRLLLEEKKELDEKLKDKQLKLSNSARRGNLGEKTFDELVSEKRPSWKLENTNGITDAMDRLLQYEGIEVRIDVKNHAEKVKYNPDYIKFKNNMKVHQETTVGILIALKACIDDNIVDHHEVYHEWTPTNQLLLYFPHFEEKYLETGFDYMEQFLQIAKHIHLFMKDNNGDEQIKMRNAFVIHKLQNAVSRLELEYQDFTKDETKIKQSYVQHYNFLRSHFDKIRRHFTNIVEDVKEDIELLAGHQELLDDETQAAVEELPDATEVPIWVKEEDKKAAKRAKSKNK